MGEATGVIGGDVPEQAQDPERVLLVHRLAGQAREPQQCERRRGITGGHRGVVEVLAPRDESLMVGGRREETAALRVGEALDHRVGERDSLQIPATLEGRLIEDEQGVDQVGVILEEPKQPSAAALPRPQQPPVAVTHPREHKGRARPRGRQIPI